MEKEICCSVISVSMSNVQFWRKIALHQRENILIPITQQAETPMKHFLFILFGTKKKFWVPMKDQTFTELRTCHLSYYLVDPSCMQDACHMNFVIDLAHCEVCVAQWRGIRRGLRIFYLSHAREKTKKSVFFLYLCMFKHKIIIIMIRLQLIIVMNTLAHKEKEVFFSMA